MAAAELEDASVAMLDIQTSIATGEAASSLNNNNKRKKLLCVTKIHWLPAFPDIMGTISFPLGTHSALDLIYS